MARGGAALALVLALTGCVTAAPVASCACRIREILRADPDPGHCRPDREDLASTVEVLTRLADYLDRAGRGEPHVLLFLDVVHRGFGGSRYADARERYDRIAAGDPYGVHMLRLARRLMVRESPLDPADLDEIVTDFDPITMRALHCDRLELGAAYAKQLQDAAAQGGYPLTHAALAWIWLGENGCALPLPGAFEDQIASDMAALIDRSPSVTDLEIEAAALLYAMGHGNRVPPEFIGQVLAAQLPDGGFRSPTGFIQGPNLHTSVLAFWLLLQHACPAEEPRFMLAGHGPG